MVLKENELFVLKAIIENPRISNMAIARQMGLSSAGVGKIRDKLEKKGIIKGYGVEVNLEALGLNTFGILHVRITPDGWKYRGRLGIQDLITSNPNIVNVYRVPGRQITHIIFCAFRNLIEFDTFLHVIQAQLSDYIEVVESFVFSGESIIKDSFTSLLVKVLDEGEDMRMPEPLLFGKIIGEE